MKHMKKVFCLFMAIAMTVSMLVGCGSSSGSGEGSNDGATVKLGLIGPMTGDYANYGTSTRDGAQVAVVDTPGALQEALSEWLKEADVVVIPTRTTSRDIEPLMRMRKAVFKHSRAKIVYVMNGWNRFKASRDFMEWFEGLAGDQTVVTLPQSEAFVQAGAAGVSVVQFDRRGKAARATRALVDTVREAAGFPRE